jgi:hypothetical protein
LAAASLTPTVGYAKGPDFYGPPTVRIVGSSGQRTFDPSGGPDGAAVWEFTQEVGLSTEGQARSVSSPGLPDSYEILFTQGPTATIKLPWYGTPTARFFYYPARGGVPAHVRLYMARASEAPHVTWLVASTSLSAMVERHAEGLAPARAQLPRPDVVPAAVGLGLMVTVLLSVGVLARRVWVPRLRRATPNSGRPRRPPESPLLCRSRLSGTTSATLYRTRPRVTWSVVVAGHSDDYFASGVPLLQISDSGRNFA